MDPKPTDESPGRPQGTSYLALVGMGVASFFVGIVIVSFAGVLFSRGGGADQYDPEKHPAVGRKLGGLDLKPLSGADEPVTLDDLAGKVVLVNFWATWCQPCRLELPHIAKLERDLRDRADFRLLAVSCGTQDPEDVERLRSETEDFLRQREIDLPTYTDPDRTTRSAFQMLTGLDATPLTFVIDRQGVLRGVWPGYAPGIEEEMAGLVDRLLEE